MQKIRSDVRPYSTTMNRAPKAALIPERMQPQSQIAQHHFETHQYAGLQYAGIQIPAFNLVAGAAIERKS